MNAAVGGHGRPLAVMLVDDDTFLLDLYAMKFRSAGFLMYECSSGVEAVQELHDGARPDAIVFDIAMPGDGGIALLKQLRDERLVPEAKLIALTNTDGDRGHAEEFGIARYVIKATVIPSEFVQMVKEELGKR